MRDTGPKRVLVVDDEPNVAMVLADALSNVYGACEFLIAENAEEAMRQARQGPIDLLITDFRMPDADGLSLVESFRQIAPHAPVILMTAYGTEQLERRAAEAGVEQVMNKPFAMDDIRRVVRQTLDKLANAPQTATPEQIRRDLSKHLAQLANDAGAHCVFLVQNDGRLLENAGSVAGLNIQLMATLVAANYAAMSEIARQMGSPSSFDALNQESKDDNVYTCAVGPDHLLVAIYDSAAKSAAISSHVRRIVPQLTELLGRVE